ncbi:ABC transporter permease [Microbacterium paludicola]|uniref:ABC transporter permease n=1 Tax=Microbacterium paludicola TaxID=300019 RepID=UPI0014320AF1|nr:ABC transporter permease [Microbacterium paludicola]MBF0817190.1 ABC transporter permease [Microbacterium paludicola]
MASLDTAVMVDVARRTVAENRINGGMRRLGRWVLKNPFAAMASLIILLYVLVTIFAPLLTAYDPNTSSARDALRAPDAAHWFGTDSIGRDNFARTIYGGRTTIIVAATSVVLGGAVGIVLGLLAGYFAGWRRVVINRTVDVLFAFPDLILAMGIAAALSPGFLSTIVAIAFGAIPPFARITYSAVVGVKDSEFVQAARLSGTRAWRIMLMHILPNVTSPILVQFTLSLGFCILAVAALSFVGLGAQPPTAEWGLMVSEGRNYILSGQWWLTFFPGLAIAVLVLSFNLLGDTLRDMLDPRVKS